MSETNINLVTPSGMVLEGTLLPDNLTVAETVAALVVELRLPSQSSSGKQLAYRLEHPQFGPCPPGATLREAGIAAGDRIHLMAVEKGPRRGPRAVSGARAVTGPRPVPAGAARRPMPSADGGVEVEVVVPDQAHAEVARLDPGRPAGELVRQLAMARGLPARDDLGELVVYRVESESLGRYLADRETLASAGVPALDRLVLHRQEHAG